ncbi:MAG: YicC family protein [Firmicutes bacterium]|nr:YicC family protein [Bacillota bacterium]
MPFSMTGYGRYKLEDDPNYLVSVEVRSVNHRFFDLTVRLPKNYSWLEESISKQVRPVLHRGKIDLYVAIEERPENRSCRLEIDQAVLADYLRQLNQVRKEFRLPGKIGVEQILLLPDLFVKKEEVNEEALEQAVVKAVQGAVQELLAMRRREGENLAADLKVRIQRLGQTIKEIERLAVALPGLYREKLTKALAELLAEVEVDEHRLAMEVLFYVERSSITEEVVRFKSHLEQFLSTLTAPGAIGKKLDFICQELNREINTIAAKTSELSISRYIVEVKSEIENMREQVQNIE